MNPLDEIKFDISGCTVRSEDARTRIWVSPAGDGFGLTLFSLPPDIEASPTSIEQVRRFYRNMAEPAGAGVIEIETPCSIAALGSERS